MTFIGLPIGTIVLDRLLRVTEVDDTFRALFGDARPIGVSLDDLVSDRDRRGATALASRLNQYRPGTIIDLQLILAVSGTERYVRLRLLAAGDGFRAYVEPTDDPSSLTYELSLLRQRWRAIVSGSEDGIAVLDASGKIIEHNQRFLELLRLRSHHGILLSSDALMGRELAELLPVDLAALGAALRAQAPEFQVDVALGVDLLAVKSRTMCDPASRRTETFVLVRDVTEQRQIEARDSIIRADLARAAQFQRSILSRLPRVDGLELGLAYEPFNAVGGDLYDVAMLDGGTLRMFIADATGHGIEAALATILIKNEYDAIKRNGNSPAATLRELNDRIAGSHRKVEAMFSCAIVDIDLAHDRLRYTNGGHPAPLLVRDGAVEALEEDGALIGIKSNLQFPEWQLDLGSWESCVLVTDGIADTRDVSGAQFGDERLYGAICEARRRGREISAEILAQVQAHRGLAPPQDDVTSLSVTRTAATGRS